jgi:3-methyladenine DNA glycosylase Tag
MTILLKVYGGNIMDNELIYEYLECIKNMQGLSWSESVLVLPKDINRAYFHEQMCQKIFGFDKDQHQHRYLRFKGITDNLNKVCNIYSDANEWKLESKHDLSMMTKYLSDFLSKTEVKMYIDGDIDNLLCIGLAN